MRRRQATATGTGKETGRITRDGRRTVLDELAQTRADITHATTIADFIEEGLAALRDVPGATIAFNRAAMNPGTTDINFHIDPPAPEDSFKMPTQQTGTYISVDHQQIYLRGHGESGMWGGNFFPSTREGAAEVLQRVTRNVTLHRQIP